MNTYIKPTNAELEILQVLWQNGPSSVRFVNEFLGQKREIGYTTTLKLMQIMFERGLVRRDDGSKTHIYEAVLLERDAQQGLLKEFVNNAFRGSAMKLVMQALGDHHATPEELEEIKALIEKIEQQEKM